MQVYEIVATNDKKKVVKVSLELELFLLLYEQNYAVPADHKLPEGQKYDKLNQLVFLVANENRAEMLYQL